MSEELNHCVGCDKWERLNAEGFCADCRDAAAIAALRQQLAAERQKRCGMIDANGPCADLPVGWEVSVNMERGAAWIEVRDDDGNMYDVPGETADTALQEQLSAAVAFVRGKDRAK